MALSAIPLAAVRRRVGTRVALLAAAVLALGATTVGADAPAAQALPRPDAAAAPTAYVVNSGSRTLSEIDTATGTVTGTVPLERREGLGFEMTEQVAAPNGKQVYVIDRHNSRISVINTDTDEAAGLFHPCRGQVDGLLFTPDGTKAFAICSLGYSKSVVGIDTSTHASALVPALDGGYALAVSPDGAELYVSSYSGVMVYDIATGAVTATVPTGGLASSLTISPDGTRVYAVVGNDVAVIDTATASLVATIPVGAAAAGVVTGLTVSPDGDRVYTVDHLDVADPAGDTGAVSVIDTATDAITSTIPLRGKIITVDSVTLSPNGKLAYVSVDYAYGKHDRSRIELVRTATAKVITTIAESATTTVSATFVGNGARAYVGPLQSASGAFYTSVVDTATGRQIAVIPATAAASMTTIADQGRRAYLNTGSFAWVVDTATNKVITTIERGGFPGDIVLTPNGAQALVVGNGAVLAVDTATNAVTKIRIPMAPVAIALTPDGSEAYVTDLYANAVTVIDTATDKITGSFALPTSDPSAAPWLGRLAFSPDGRTLYVVDNGNILVVDTASHRVTGTITIGVGGGEVGQLAVTADGSTLYVGDGTRVVVVDTATDKVSAGIALFGTGDTGSGSVALSPDGTALYATGFTGFIGSLSVVDTATDTITTTLNLPAYDETDTAVAVAVVPGGTQAYLTNGAEGTVSVIDTATDTVSSTIDVGKLPFAVAIGP